MISAEALKHSGLKHGFFTRKGGVSTGIYAGLNAGLGSDDERANVIENRRRIAESLGVEADLLVSPYQIHSPNVIRVERPWQEGDDRKADALVTAKTGLAIGVSTADCGPVLFADPEARVIGAAHAGWKGALTGVLENTVSAMESLGADRGRIVAVLGPTISRKAYEVGPEFHDRFAAEDGANRDYFTPSGREGHFMFDLPAYIAARLQRLGLAHAENLDLCTYSDEEYFFSYRRTTHRSEPDYGRLLSAIVLT